MTQYVNNASNKTVDYIGETVQSFISDDYTAEHIGMTHYLIQNVEVAFKHNGNWVTNNALGTVVIFKEGHKHFFLPKDKFEKELQVQ